MKGNESLEAIYAEVVTRGGGVYRGLQSGFGNVPPLVLFDDLHYSRRSTLALSSTDITSDRVRHRLKQQRLDYIREEFRYWLYGGRT